MRDCPPSLRDFNSIKVRLKRVRRVCRLRTPDQFQFHKGTIKTHTHHREHAEDFDFNSIKVRLKRSRALLRVARRQFQFHKGTIKTAVRLQQGAARAWFQFHKGTIKTLSRLRTIIRNRYFNSIKVRLKPSCSTASRASLSFQFHKGTIKTFISMSHTPHLMCISIP